MAEQVAQLINPAVNTSNADAIKMRKQFDAIYGTIILVSLMGCGRNLDVVREGKVIESKISPNGMVEAVVSAVDNGDGGLGATMSQAYQVYLRTKRPGLKDIQVVLAAQRTEGFRLHWAMDSRLIVCHATAHIFRIDNRFYVSGKDHVASDDVEVVLRRVEKLEECDTL